MKPPLSHPLILTLAGFVALVPVHSVEVDTSFSSSVANGTVHSISITPQGEILLGGQFNLVNSAAGSSVAKLTASGAVDTNFSAAPVGSCVFATDIGTDGRLFVAGSAGLFCLASNGTSLPGFQPLSPSGWVKSLALVGGNQVVMGGSFTPPPGCFAARLLADGTPDPAFHSGLQSTLALEAGLAAIAALPDGKVIVGGNFEVASAFATLARLNPNGSVDSTFGGNHGPVLYPKAIVVLAGGKVLVAGTADSTGRGFVRRLNSNGSVDASFAESTLDRSVEALAIDFNGRILVGGSFNQLNGTPRERLARLNADGSIDPSWTLGADNVVTALVVDSDGSVLVGGAFTEIGGVTRIGIARLKEASSFGFKPLSVSSSGEMHLSLKGDVGRTYVIESSNDLRGWTVFKTNAATVEGLAVSASTGDASRQFFRARLAQ